MGLLDDAIREHLDLKRRRGGDPAEIERLEREALGPVRRGPGPEAVLDPQDDRTAVLGRDIVEGGDLDEPLDERLSGGYAERRGLLTEPPDEEPADAGSEVEPRARPSRLRPLSLRERIRGRGSAAAPIADTFDEEPEDDYADDLEAPSGAVPSGGAGHAVAPAEPDRWAESDEKLDPAPSPPAPHAAEPPQSGDASAVERSEPPEPIVFDHLSQPTAEYDVIAEEHGGEAPGGKTKGPDGEDVLEETPDFLQDTPDHDRLWFEQRPPRDFDFDG